MAQSILFVITDSGVGGSEKNLTEILARLNRELFTIAGVVVLKSKRQLGLEWEKMGIPVFFLNMGTIPAPWNLISLWNIIQKTKPNIVLAFLYHASQLARLTHFFNKSFKLISSPRVNYRFAPKLALMVDRILKQQDDAVISESNATKDFLCGHIGYSKEKVQVVYNGVNIQKFIRDPAGREEIRQELDITKGEILIGGVGRLHPQKGFDCLIQGLAAMGPTTPGYKLIVIGDGEEKKKLQELARRHSLPVQFLGLRRDMPRIYSALDIYVQSSRYEGMPNALLEAMACEAPSITTAVDGVLDFAIDGENLLMVPPEQPDALGQAIKKLIEDPSLRLKLSKEGTKTAHRFSTEIMVKNFENILCQFH